MKADRTETRGRGAGLTGAVFGLSAMILAAAGAHLVPESSTSSRAIWQVALSIHFYHALALLALTAILRRDTSIFLTVTTWCFAFGTIVFSGTLYVTAIGALEWPAGTTPSGGVLLMAGWISLIGHFAAGFRNRTRKI